MNYIDCIWIPPRPPTVEVICGLLLTDLTRRQVVVERSCVGRVGEELGQWDSVLLGNHLEAQEVAIYAAALNNL